MIMPSEFQYFLAVTRSLNFSRASEKLGISQPSLSLGIKRLETELGVSLFVRHKKGVTLTTAGKAFLVNIKKLLQDWEGLKSKTWASEFSIQGNVTIGCHPTLAQQIFPHFLPDLLSKNPGLNIHFIHENSRKITEQVINLSIDLGIVVNPVRHPDLIIRKLYQDETAFWVGKGKKDIQNIKSKDAVLICDPDLPQVETLIERAKKKNIHFSRILKSSNHDVTYRLVAAGCGIGILPHTAKKELSPIPNMPTFHDEICLIYRIEHKNVKSIETVITAIKSNTRF